jgi:hypothetical protein
MKKATVYILRGGQYVEYKTFERTSFNISTTEATLKLSSVTGDMFAGPVCYFMISIEDVKK